MLKPIRVDLVRRRRRWFVCTAVSFTVAAVLAYAAAYWHSIHHWAWMPSMIFSGLLLSVSVLTAIAAAIASSDSDF